VPILQATSTTAGIASFVWQKTPGWVKFILVVAIVIAAVFVSLQVYWGVRSLKRRFFVDPKTAKMKVSSDYFRQVCEALVARAKERAAKSAQLTREKQKEEAFAHACASAAYLRSALAVMPKLTVELMPSCKEAIGQIDQMLAARHERPLPAPLVIKETALKGSP
jgi:hypothetical protein